MLYNISVHKVQDRNRKNRETEVLEKMSEVGIIGQMYEDQRTRKRGKLLERDEKYKTLLMESPEGKSFNITFGGFKSNWREVEPAEVVEPVTEPVKEEVIEEKPVKKERKKQAERDVNPELEDMALKVLDYSKTFNDVKVSTNVVPIKRRVTLKVDNRRIFILTHKSRKHNFDVCVHENLYLRIRDNKYVKDASFHDTWQSMKYSFVIEIDEIGQFFEDIRPYVIDCICGVNKED